MIQIDFTTKPEIVPEYFIHKHGNKFLYDSEGNLHSYNYLPAVVYINGTKVWCKHGAYHRDNGLPAIVWSDGEKSYYIDGKFIRKEKP